MRLFDGAGQEAGGGIFGVQPESGIVRLDDVTAVDVVADARDLSESESR